MDHNPEDSNALLLQRLLDGDEETFTELVDRYHSSLIALARAFGHNRASAEELVQDTWLAVIDGIHRFEGRSSLKTWIFRILTYKAQKRALRERRMVNWSDLVDTEVESPTIDPNRFTPQGTWAEAPSSWGPDPERRLMQNDTLQAVQRALEDLPPVQRSVLVLRDVEGWSSEEVCEALEITAGNQRVLLHRARNRVRHLIDDTFKTQRR